MTYTSSATSAAVRVGVASANGTNSYAGNTSDGLFIWGAQLEQNIAAKPAGATPYIPTTTAAATVTDYTLSNVGVVSLGQAPLVGAALTWTGSFYWCCRFDTDDGLDLSEFMNNLRELKKLNFTTVKL